jgi:hypothetical protein
MKAIKKVKSKSGDLILRKIGGLILLVTQNCEKMINFAANFSKQSKAKMNNNSYRPHPQPLPCRGGAGGGVSIF